MINISDYLAVIKKYVEQNRTPEVLFKYFRYMIVGLCLIILLCFHHENIMRILKEDIAFENKSDDGVMMMISKVTTNIFSRIT
jgi:cytochrome bd-type quinol oxidase subunit 1